MTAPEAGTDAPPDADDSREDLLRVVVRAVFAMVLAELGSLAVLLLVLMADEAAPTTAAIQEVAAYALGFGLGAGLAYAWADAVARRRHVVLGLAVGMLLAPLAPLAGCFEQALLSSRDVVTATRVVVEALHELTRELQYLCAAGALCVHGPALVAWRRGVRLPGLLTASAWGGASFSLAAAPLAEHFGSPQLSTAWTLLATRCGLFPLGLVLGDLSGAWISRRIRRSTAGPERGPSWRPLARTLAAPLVLVLPLPLLANAALAPTPGAAPDHVVAAWTIHDPEAAWRRANDLLSIPPPGRSGRPSPRPRVDLINVAAAHGAWTEAGAPFDAAEILLRRASAAGHLPSMLLLAEELGPRLPDEAVSWLRRAAATGDPCAAETLGLRLLYGWVGPSPGVHTLPTSDTDEALRWLCHAARHGLGLEHLARHGVPPAEVVDLARAHARDARSEQAALTLERLLLRWPHLRRARLDDPLRPAPRAWSPASEVADLAPFLPDAVPGADDPDVERALVAMHADDLDEAVRRAEVALDRAPEHPGALTLLGLASLLRARRADPVDGRDGDLAIAYLARAERQAPRDPTVVLNLGIAHAHRALRQRPFDMVATSEAFERLVLIERQGDAYARVSRQALQARLGYAAPVITPERAEDALARRRQAWARSE